jgi:hypothetical protein
MLTHRKNARQLSHGFEFLCIIQPVLQSNMINWLLTLGGVGVAYPFLSRRSTITTKNGFNPIKVGKNTQVQLAAVF